MCSHPTSKRLERQKKNPALGSHRFVSDELRLSEARGLPHGHLNERELELWSWTLVQVQIPGTIHDPALAPTTSTGPSMRETPGNNCPPSAALPAQSAKPCCVSPKSSQSCSQHPGHRGGLPPQSLLSQMAFCDRERRIRGKPQTGALGSSHAS